VAILSQDAGADGYEALSYMNWWGGFLAAAIVLCVGADGTLGALAKIR